MKIHGLHHQEAPHLLGEMRLTHLKQTRDNTTKGVNGIRVFYIISCSWLLLSHHLPDFLSISHTLHMSYCKGRADQPKTKESMKIVAEFVKCELDTIIFVRTRLC